MALSAFAGTVLGQSSSPQDSSSPSSPSRDLSSPAPPKQSGVSSSSRTESGEPVPLPETEVAPRPNAAQLAAIPAAVDPTGPTISLEISEAMFDVMAGLNTCGYNEGLSISDPLRQKVRDDVDQALEESAAARDSRDRLCSFIHSHTMNGVSVNLAAYISLALFLTPPPELTTNVSASDLPPDAATLVGLASPLRNFSQAVGLHVIWVLNHPAYEALANKVRTAMNQMLIQTDLYLKQPPVTNGNSRFLVIMDPLIASGEENARVYGGDYIVVSSPTNGKIDLKPVKHTYLRFILEPLIYARSESINQLRPILELVQPSPLPYIYKSDVLTLVTECMIRAIEARSMDTGVPVYKILAHVDRSQLAAVDKQENDYEHAVAEVRNDTVHNDMIQGFILTQYFYDQLRGFDESPRSLPQMVGIMIYGMNVDIEKHRVQEIVFATHTDQNVATPVAPQSADLDNAETKLIAGDTAAAAQLAQRALDQHPSDPGRAYFILARANIMSGKMDAAVQDFNEAAKVSHDLRTIAWSHIYLGRLDDLQGNRTAAVAEYQAAMQSRDGRQDTSRAAEAGLKAPFARPQAAQQGSHGQDDPAGDGTDASH
jgi:tetratricopeptide (TPR) repeat protein